METGHTIAEHAAAFSVSESTVRREIAAGRLLAVRIRRCVRILDRQPCESSYLRNASGYLETQREASK